MEQKHGIIVNENLNCVVIGQQNTDQFVTSKGLNSVL